MSNATFPSAWPDGCPPVDAVDAADAVFRIVDGPNPTNDSFRSHFELGKCKQCNCRSLSVFQTKAKAAKCQSILQYLGDHIAWGVLTSAHGKTKLADKKHPGHTEWWVAEGVVPSAVLATIEALP